MTVESIIVVCYSLLVQKNSTVIVGDLVYRYIVSYFERTITHNDHHHNPGWMSIMEFDGSLTKSSTVGTEEPCPHKTRGKIRTVILVISIPLPDIMDFLVYLERAHRDFPNDISIYVVSSFLWKQQASRALGSFAQADQLSMPCSQLKSDKLFKLF